MSQPVLQIEVVRRPDVGVEGKTLLRKSMAFKVNCAAGTATLITLPAYAFVVRAFAWMQTALDAGTLEVGYSGNADAFIDSADWTETTVNQIASNGDGTNADAKLGYLCTAATAVIATVTSAASGVAYIVLEWYELGDVVDSELYLREVTAA